MATEYSLLTQNGTAGSYWASLTTEQKARYLISGSSYRCYATMAAAQTAINGWTSDYSKTICLEVEGAWEDSTISYTNMSNKWYSLIITSKINGVRGSAHHNGVRHSGYRRVNNSSDSTLSTQQARTIIDGLDFSSNGGYGLNITAPSGQVMNCIVRGIHGLRCASPGLSAYNNIATGCSTYGFSLYQSYGADASVYAFNIAVGCGTGFFGANAGATCVGNISIGSTTANWGTAPTNTYLAYNAGISTDNPWGVNDVVMATTDFVDYAGGNYYPAAITSPQVNTLPLADGDGLPRYDIVGDERPNYNPDTTPWNVTAGPFEFDTGHGLPPISVTFTDLQAGSTVRVFTTGTTTELASTTNSGTTFDAAGSNGTIDYTILKDGFIPLRVTGVALFDGITISGTQTTDRAYATSSGLTYGTTATINTSTKIFSLTTASTGQNWYSFWIEQFRTNTDLRNVDFPLQANGPNSFSLRLGYEFDDADSIALLSRDGIRYVNTSGVQTAVYAALLSVGVPSGARVRYQQTDGGTTVNAAITSGNIDELIQVYGDATHGNFDRRGYLVCKVQEMGYDQVETDVVGQYGALEDQLYVIGLAPLPNTIETGNPSLANPPTITDHAGSPVTWNSKDFSITIEDSAAGNSGTDIMRWLRYYFEQGGTFQGKDAFNWHDLVQQNGSDFKTIRGKIYGDTGATLKGVRVVKNGTDDPHADFTLFTADDGTTYAPPIVAAAEATILADSRVRLYNVTTDTEIDNVFSASTAYSYTITTEASVGDTLRLNVCKKGRQSTPAYAVWGAAGVTFLVSQPEETIYTTWGIDGANVTEFALDVTGTVEIDANDVDGSTQKTRLGAWYSYILTTEDGIRYLYGSITFLAPNAIRINVDVLDLEIENINASTALKFTDLDVRLFRSDGTSIIAPTSYSIHNDYTGVPDVVETGVSGLTSAESNQLFALPTNVAPQVQAGMDSQGYTVARAANLDALTTTVDANIVSVNGTTISGAGTEIDPWGP